jgi:phosphoserine phosphatase
MDRSHWSAATYSRLSSLLDGPPGLAAFDFDHTLIQGDHGEALMNEIILGGHVRADEPWFWEHWPSSVHRAREEQRAAYERFRYFDDPMLLIDWMDGIIDVYEAIRNELGTEAAYRWSSIFFAGFHEEELADLSRKVFENALTARSSIALPSGRELPAGIRIRAGLQELIREMLDRKWTVYIVTASPRIPIAVLSHHWNLLPEQVIGMELHRMEDGRLGPQIVEPYPCAEGKVRALRRRSEEPLRFAAGDSVMDMALLEEAETAMVIDRGSVALRRKAVEKDWIFETLPVMD